MTKYIWSFYLFWVNMSRLWHCPHCFVISFSQKQSCCLLSSFAFRCSNGSSSPEANLRPNTSTSRWWLQTSWLSVPLWVHSEPSYCWLDLSFISSLVLLFFALFACLVFFLFLLKLHNCCQFYFQSSVICLGIILENEACTPPARESAA